MRRLLIAGSVTLALLAGAMAAVWANRVPLAEWAVETYQPATPLGRIEVRIRDFTFSSISIAEIRADFRGPVTVQDVTAEFALPGEWGEGWHVTLPAVRVGAVNASLSFADWFELLRSFEADGAEDGAAGMPPLPVTIGKVDVETIDLYAETPKGFALLNGNLTLGAPVDLSKPDALARLTENTTGDLFLSAGAVGFPVDALMAGGIASGAGKPGGALGGGSIVLAANLSGRSLTIQAVTPIRVDMEITEPLPAVPTLPAGAYRLDIGSDDLPFGMTVGYAATPSPRLRSLSLDPFPFSLDTPFGTADAEALTAPITVTNEPADAASLPVQMAGTLNLSSVPLPLGITADIIGAFAIDKGQGTVIEVGKGFTLAAGISASPLRAAIPPAMLEAMSDKVSLSARNDIRIEITTGSDGMAATGTGSLALKSGALAANLPKGFVIDADEAGNMDLFVKTLTAAAAPGKLPLSGDVTLTDLSAKLGMDGNARGKAQYRLSSDLASSEGEITFKRTGDVMEAAVAKGSLVLPASELSVPAFRAEGRLAGDVWDLSGSMDEVLVGELRALKKPLSMKVRLETNDRGGAFTANGSIDPSIAIGAEGRFAGGDVVMSFRSDEIPLGPAGADLSELSDIVDLGRSDPNGSIRVEGEMTYRQGAVSGYADVHIAEIGSVLADGTSISVLGTVTFDLSRLPATLKPATLTGSLTSDILGTIPFKETFTLRETGEMEVKSLEAEFLGGTVTVSEGIASAAAGTLTGRMRAAGLDLEALAEMLQIEGLAGTGRLTGDLKFQVLEDAVIVEAGKLSAEEPGVLRYKGAALTAAAEGNDNLALLVQALEDFHYDVLTLGIDIPEFGEGIISLHLEGKNPKVLDGYPFDVTINLESEYGRLIKKFLELYQQMDVILQGAVR